MNDLSLDLNSLMQPGRKPAKLAATIVRELRPADFVLLSENREIKPIPIERITERHHAAARLLAQGAKPGEVAIILGYTPGRISVLQQSPAFQELVSIYRDTVDTEFANVAERMAGLSKDALNELQERLEEEPEKFSNKMLLDLVTATADRTGNGPTSKQVNVNINAELGDRLEAARMRAKRSAMGDVVDAEVVSEAPSDASETD